MKEQSDASELMRKPQPHERKVKKGDPDGARTQGRVPALNQVKQKEMQ